MKRKLDYCLRFWLFNCNRKQVSNNEILEAPMLWQTSGNYRLLNCGEMWQDGGVQWENSGQWLYPRVRKFVNILQTGRAMKVVQQWNISPGDVPNNVTGLNIFFFFWTEHFNTRQEYIDQMREEVSHRVKSQYPCPFWCWFNFSNLKRFWSIQQD